MKRFAAALLVGILLVFSLPAGALAGPPDGLPAALFSEEQLLVQFRPGVGLPEAALVHSRLGGQVKETIAGIGVQVVSVPRGQALAKVRAYSSHPLVAFAEPDSVVQALDTPNDPYFASQWGMVKIQAPGAWDVTTGSSSVRIAILDTGVDQDHPDLATKIVSNKNFTGSATAADVHGHGTHVAGIAAAIANNGIGVAGLGYSSSIMNVKVLGDDGFGYWSWVAGGIIWAADNGARVINMSLGGSSGSSTLESAVNYAWNKGVVVVAAAGNSGSTAPEYPAYYANCMAVAATDQLDNLASWSSRGEWVDLAAPGNAIYSTLRNASYGYKTGTSMASPHVAGLAALVFTVVSDSSGNGRLNDEVRARIEATCDDIGVSGIGWGRINAYKAVAGGTTQPPPPPPPPPPSTGSIVGCVTDAADGSPISGATVACGTASTMTASQGEFSFVDLAPGTYTMSVSAEGYEAASQTVEVVAGETATVNMAVTKLPPPPPKDMWVEGIGFRMTGKNLNMTVKVVDTIGALGGVAVRLTVTNGGQDWYFTGVTGSSGSITFTINKAPAGTYTANVTGLTASGYEWDTASGVISASYTLSTRSNLLKNK